MKEHYEAIAKIVGGSLHSSNRLTPLINSLIGYFSSYDEQFDAEKFRLDAMNGRATDGDKESTIDKPLENT